MLRVVDVVGLREVLPVHDAVPSPGAPDGASAVV
jgi:hypothetical protein